MPIKSGQPRHDLAAALQMCRGRIVPHFASWPLGMVQHVLAEIALAAVGA
ncbi:hypothetical protein QA649_40250 [Bradyrhizobium sp. CB1717]|nr:hypothetical protein [Bradyrhizobium sp. CB1717]WFU24165.1 hypothetical protein QA649_40250 [Bradyrhizobium sp. CB1717]